MKCDPVIPAVMWSLFYGDIASSWKKSQDFKLDTRIIGHLKYFTGVYASINLVTDTKFPKPAKK